MNLTTINSIFENQIEKNSLSHAYLFSGPKGVKKFQTALNLSKRLTGAKDEFQDINTIILDKEKYLKEDITYVLDEFSKSTLKGKKRFLIINNANLLNVQSQNTLLKFIEEPPSDIHIILVTTNINMILDTIKSRCFIVNFSSIKNDDFKDEFLEFSDILSYITNDIEYASKLFVDEEFHKLFNLADLFLKDQAAAHFENYNFKILTKENIDLFLEIVLYKSMKEINNNFYNTKLIESVLEFKNKLKSNVNFDLIVDIMFVTNYKEGENK